MSFAVRDSYYADSIDYSADRLNYYGVRRTYNAVRTDNFSDSFVYGTGRPDHGLVTADNYSFTCHYCVSPALLISVTLFVASLPQSLIRARFFFIDFMVAVRG